MSVLQISTLGTGNMPLVSINECIDFANCLFLSATIEEEDKLWTRLNTLKSPIAVCFALEDGAS